ncbi:50S ribosomal protein L2 [Candidatus Kuenenbacteria bacterium RIFCSPLOWO2_12_FULL_42_13]|uniref:Large ribosomal subunit protein uL2 n=5 Tax=Candidatus Kueneniibacteriota TaxID=1752740 RepID=A0A0G0YWS7_9BACT|nr:MAG: 50S ribosomal protein L2 [Candidatus Kuenenbacteria bacterium GW2011_GWA2_42_15]OGG89416.1 MAG: 50S ribosomal protein L2 [Candidatus Kuenenbacteria bacterium RIFCSPHIGHO2_02_FULL_42_29]OGG89773.1 MAG: 50S ribosomal protein L2 [Candidatus Kuenenbacteria bacterium RIFCSPLOWO2_02_FULL_42_16]OGG91714.1 MAG: 50S ribosomal protein L2 [Candidatus Kuenenbacteria bacterium RIFCSPLOWO2_12_FULL_42_13]OGG95798.1 MAG: 50S ribosomal protein L2 [Candidatus Kuenenbacteria bacterium RBG_16_41_7]OGH0125
MAIKLYNPTTPARRKTSIVLSSDLTKKRPEKKLTRPKKQSGGRNQSGQITVRHRGGGAKRRIRIVDFKRHLFGQTAKVLSIEYDPNRSARLALIVYPNGVKSYILAADGMKIDDEIISSKEKIDVKIGNCMPLKFIPLGVMVHNVELEPDKGAVIARSAGNGIFVQAIEGPYAQLKMPSGEIRLVKKECLATIGQVSNPDHGLVRYGKAGRMRHKGVRPTVRGKAMNPCDHPHGGGEGRHPIGMPYPKTLWGKHALGVKTRKPKKWSSKLIIARRKRNRKEL